MKVNSGYAHDTNKQRNRAMAKMNNGTLNKGYLYALAAAIIWSGFILVSRLGGVSELTVYDVIAIRYATCTAILLPIWWFKFRFNLLQPKFIGCSLIGGLAYALCTFNGFGLASASEAAVLLPGLIPLFIIIGSAVINGEKHTRQAWFGTAVITLGVFSLLWPALSQQQGLAIGHVYLVAGAFCWALFSVLIKRWGISPWQATVSLAVLTCLFYLPVYIAFLPKNLAFYLWSDIAVQAFYQGFMATIVQMILYVKAVQSIGPAAMGNTMAIVPLLSGITAIVIFKEAVTFELISGLILVSLGAWVTHVQWRSNAAIKIN